MSTSSPEPLDRLDELLADAMVRELSAEEAAEMETLAAHETDALVASAEQAAVATQLAFAAEDRAEAPAALRAQLQAQAQEYFGHLESEVTSPAPTLSMPKPAASAPQSTAPQSKSSLFPWMVAAAAMLLAVAGWAPRFLQEAPLSVQQEFQAMISEAPSDMVRFPWQVLPDPLSEGAAGGEIIWSDSEQRGYMKFSGLAANDPSVEQYQLWIFDNTNDTATPVDGGVFDIPAGQTEVLIPIAPKIPVKQAFQFAITVETPGGVVVSKRERIPLLANGG